MVKAVLPRPEAVIVEDDDGMVTYQPRDAWFARRNPKVYTENGYHVSRSHGASVEFAFAGSSVWVYGDTNRDHGDYEVRIDGGEPEQRSGFTRDWRIMQVLYTAKLPAGSHTINITNLSTFKAFSLDYFAYIPLVDSDPLSTGASPDPIHQSTSTAASTSASASASTSIPTGAVVGIVLGIFGLVLFAILGFLIVRDRRKKKLRGLKNIMPWGYAPVDLGAGPPGPGRAAGLNPVQTRDAGRPVYPASLVYAHSRRPESYISVEPTLSDFPQSWGGASVVTRPSGHVHGDISAEDGGSTGAPPRPHYFTFTEGGTLTVGMRSPT